MCDEMKLEIINFMKKYFATAGYPVLHVKVNKDGNTVHKLYIPQKKVNIVFNFNKKEILVIDEKGKELIYDIGLILRTMIILL
nr:MAG TPA_asm: hypothetical protein [Caudoviricetes sp.]